MIHQNEKSKIFHINIKNSKVICQKCGEEVALGGEDAHWDLKRASLKVHFRTAFFTKYFPITSAENTTLSVRTLLAKVFQTQFFQLKSVSPAVPSMCVIAVTDCITNSDISKYIHVFWHVILLWQLNNFWCHLPPQARPWSPGHGWPFPECIARRGWIPPPRWSTLYGTVQEQRKQDCLYTLTDVML